MWFVTHAITQGGKKLYSSIRSGALLWWEIPSVLQKEGFTLGQPGSIKLHPLEPLPPLFLMVLSLFSFYQLVPQIFIICVVVAPRTYSWRIRALLCWALRECTHTHTHTRWPLPQRVYSLFKTYLGYPCSIHRLCQPRESLKTTFTKPSSPNNSLFDWFFCQTILAV